jgi:hypothetical protein
VSEGAFYVDHKWTWRERLRFRFPVAVLSLPGHQHYATLGRATVVALSFATEPRALVRAANS